MTCCRPTEKFRQVIICKIIQPLVKIALDLQREVMQVQNDTVLEDVRSKYPMPFSRFLCPYKDLAVESDKLPRAVHVDR